jgi:hypothetical protein
MSSSDSDTTSSATVSPDPRFQALAARFAEWVDANDTEQPLTIEYYDYDTLPPIPDGVQVLRFIKCRIQEFPVLPATLKQLNFYKTACRKAIHLSDGLLQMFIDESFVNFQGFPYTLQELRYVESHLNNLPPLPVVLRKFTVLDCIATLPYPQLPPSLETFEWLYTEIDDTDFIQIPETVQHFNVEGQTTRQGLARFLARRAAEMRG